MRICQVLGIPHPDHLKDILTNRQLEDWIDFHHAEPWGTPVTDFYAALQAWASRSQFTKSKPEDYLPNYNREAVGPALYKEKHQAFMARSKGISG